MIELKSAKMRISDVAVVILCVCGEGGEGVDGGYTPLPNSPQWNCNPASLAQNNMEGHKSESESEKVRAREKNWFFTV